MMRMQRLDGDDVGRTVGAAVVRSLGAGDMVLELGPADGPASFRLTMSNSEANRLIAAIQEGAQSGGESIMIVDE